MCPIEAAQVMDVEIHNPGSLAGPHPGRPDPAVPEAAAALRLEYMTKEITAGAGIDCRAQGGAPLDQQPHAAISLHKADAIVL